MERTETELTVKRIVKFEGEGSIKAYCDVAVGGLFLIKGLRVIEGKNGVFVSMPRQQTKGGTWFDSVEPLSPEVKEEVGRIVLKAYQEDRAEARRT